MCVAAIVSVTAVVGMPTNVGCRKDRPNITRKQKHVNNIYESIGDDTFRKVCHMNIISFWRLHKFLFE